MQLEAIKRLSSSLPSTARQHRLGMSASASLQMLQVVDDLLLVIQDPNYCERLGPPLEKLLAAQERGDTLCVADFLEHVLLAELG
jgi:hypothetical protein